MVKNIKQFDTSWKNVNILISEILNSTFFPCEKYKNFSRIVRAALKRKYDNSFHKSYFSYTVYLVPSVILILSKRNEVWDEVYIYIYSLLLYTGKPTWIFHYPAVSIARAIFICGLSRFFFWNIIIKSRTRICKNYITDLQYINADFVCWNPVSYSFNYLMNYSIG